MGNGAKCPIFCLGTVNFGLEYGIASGIRKIEKSQVAEILNFALEIGVTHFDTASAYGDAEMVIGQFLPEEVLAMVTTKLPRSVCISPKSIILCVDRSLANTRLKCFWSVLLHDSSVLFGENATKIKNGLLDLLESGKAKHIGVSAYTEDEVLAVKEFMPELTVFQLPENVCDRRMFSSIALANMALHGDFFFVRSIFLQGLLLMDPEALPTKVSSAKPTLVKIREYCHDHAISPLDLCIGYARSIPWAAGVVIGADSLKQLGEVHSFFLTAKTQDYSSLATLDGWLLDPRNWS